jgi:hypothetical protein
MLEAAGYKIQYFVIQLNLIVLWYWKSEGNNILPLFISGTLVPRRSQTDMRNFFHSRLVSSSGLLLLCQHEAWSTYNKFPMFTDVLVQMTLTFLMAININFMVLWCKAPLIWIEASTFQDLFYHEDGQSRSRLLGNSVTSTFARSCSSLKMETAHYNASKEVVASIFR